MKHRRLLDKPFIALFLLLTLTGITFAQGQAQSQTAKEVSECKTTSASTNKGEGQTFFGESRKLGNGVVRSWVKLDEACKPAAIGVTFTEAALTGLPTEPPAGGVGYWHELALPPQASMTPFNHISLDWNPKGHEPEHIYTVGHFDFHFYLISPAERQAMTLQGDDLAKFKRAPAAEFVPEDYFYAPGSEVPGMGAHWLYKNAHELHGHAFTSTFIYGSYDGQFIFLEPMITKAFLETKPNLTLPVKQPAKFEKPGYYPTTYSVKYDAQTREYTVALLGLTMR